MEDDGLGGGRVVLLQGTAEAGGIRGNSVGWGINIRGMAGLPADIADGEGFMGDGIAPGEACDKLMDGRRIHRGGGGQWPAE